MAVFVSRNESSDRLLGETSQETISFVSLSIAVHVHISPTASITPSAFGALRAFA